MKKKFALIALALVIICFGAIGCSKPDYSKAAGDYKVVSVSGGEKITFKSFNYFEISLDSKGNYSFNYSLILEDKSENVTSGKGTFSITDNKIAFAKDITGEGKISEGFFSIETTLLSEKLTLTFVLF